VKEINDQHKTLIQAINDLFEACSEGKGRKKIAETMDFLQNYIDTHFGDEEKLQIRYGYPEYLSHKKLHEEFVQSVNEYKNMLETQGPTIVLVAKLNSFISNWLTFHISREDKKIGDYIMSKN
jgi:hemerythrin